MIRGVFSDNSLSRDDISPPHLDRILRRVDLLNDALAHEVCRNELGPVLVHSHQELLAAVVNKANAGQIDKKIRLSG